MAVFKTTILGRRAPVLIKAEGLRELTAAIFEAEKLSADQVEEALVGGSKVWKSGDPFPADPIEGFTEFETGEALKANTFVELRDGKIYAVKREASGETDKD